MSRMRGLVNIDNHQIDPERVESISPREAYLGAGCRITMQSGATITVRTEAEKVTEMVVRAQAYVSGTTYTRVRP